MCFQFLYFDSWVSVKIVFMHFRVVCKVRGYVVIFLRSIINSEKKRKRILPEKFGTLLHIFILAKHLLNTRFTELLNCDVQKTFLPILYNAYLLFLEFN